MKLSSSLAIESATRGRFLANALPKGITRGTIKAQLCYIVIYAESLEINIDLVMRYLYYSLR